MGIAGVGIWQLVVIAVIIMLLFGTKRIRQAGGDLGGFIKGLRTGLTDKEFSKIKKAIKEKTK